MASKTKRRIRSFRVEIDDMTYETGLSLLMLLQAKRRERRKKSLLHRLIFLARVTTELAGKRDPGGYYEGFLQKLQRSHQEGITGLLLLYPNYAIHVLESSSDMLFSVIQDLRDMQQQQERALLLEPKILVLSHNIPSRLFQHWEYILLNFTAKRLDDTLKGEPLEKIISECITVLLKLGMHIQKVSKELPHRPADSMLDNVPELIVPEDLIRRLLRSNELLTPAQFLCIYNASVNIIMDSAVGISYCSFLRSRTQDAPVWKVLGRAGAIPNCDTTRKDAFYGASVKADMPYHAIPTNVLIPLSSARSSKNS